MSAEFWGPLNIHYPLGGSTNAEDRPTSYNNVVGLSGFPAFPNPCMLACDSGMATVDTA